MRADKTATTPTARVQVDPPHAMAGVRDTWDITISGIALPKGGMIRLQIGGGRDNKSDWERPQTTDPAANEYVTATCSGKAQVKVAVPPFEQQPDVAVLLTVAGAALRKSDEVRVTLGDISGGGDGSTAQTFSQPAKRFKASVASPPAEGEERRFEPAGEAIIEVTGAPLDHVKVFAPSTVPAGKQFSITIKAEDSHGNVAWNYAGELNIEVSDEEIVTGPEHVDIPASAGGVIAVEGFRAFSRGLCRVIVTGMFSGVKYVSNPILITRHDEPQLYWGVIHGHTERTDGIGTVEDYYACMRDHNRLDFGAVGDHDHEWETSDEDWEVIGRVTAETNEPGR
ncbi:MAG TPA: hypothetical protein VM283_03630, partial [Armatimonadota bacterium]|nr:hypothetical protein [Armatimonadota bacterium]